MGLNKIIFLSSGLEQNHAAVAVAAAGYKGSTAVVTRRVIEVAVDHTHSPVHLCLVGLLAQHSTEGMVVRSHEITRGLQRIYH